MRKKVEKKIRQAITTLENSEFYRIDRVREKAGVIKKVFDKTILDMARVGTIELTGGDTSAMSSSQIGNLILQGDQLHVYLKLIDAETEPESLPSENETTDTLPLKLPETEPPEPANTEILLLEIDPDLWQRFIALCSSREDKGPDQKIREMIQDYSHKGEN
jgi:hypothetical protein